MTASGEVGRKLIFFAPDLTDTSTIKRVDEFVDYGYAPTVLSFRRARYNRHFTPTWPHVVLGETTDGKYRQRIWSLLRGLTAVVRQREVLGSAKIYYARNVDQLVLALLVRYLRDRHVPVVYEVLDIPQVMVGSGLVSRLLRGIERLCLRRITLLVLSSPGFHQNYYSALQGYAGPWFLLENKLHPSVLKDMSAWPQQRHQRSRGDGKWVVAYYGLIRGQSTIDLITRLSRRLRDRVVFKFRGVLTTVDKCRFHAALEENQNIVYEGEYANPKDLGRLYGEVDFAWAIDLEHVDHNSRWLLPCRFYEAGLFGVPCLAMRRFEVGALVDRLGVGWTFQDPIEDTLVQFFETISQSDYDFTRRRLDDMPRGAFVAGADVRHLCQILDCCIDTTLRRNASPLLAGANDFSRKSDNVPL